MEQMTFLDFFAGIGGFRKGFELCGMRCVGHCEIDKYADRSYRAIHDVKEDEWYAADITKVAPADLPRADLWAGGFPCQDISVAGRQRGLDGARSGLFFTLAQLVKGQSPENRPTWIVLENVKNLLSIHGGWDFGPFSIRWPHSAIISNTDCSIQSISAPLKIESECSLSLADILEPDADPKYFLSPQAVAKLLSNS